MPASFAQRQRKQDVFENAKAFSEGRPVQQKRLKKQKGGPVLAPLTEIITETHIHELSELMATGLTLYAACGALKLNPSLLAPAFAANPHFVEHLDIAKLRRLHYLERGLLHSRSPPVVAASMFALKNADPQAWQDRPGPPIAVGVSAQITIITGVPEAHPQNALPSPPSAETTLDLTPNDRLFVQNLDEDPLAGPQRVTEPPPDAHK
jgi:hypothetical protein